MRISARVRQGEPHAVRVDLRRSPRAHPHRLRGEVPGERRIELPELLRGNRRTGSVLQLCTGRHICHVSGGVFAPPSTAALWRTAPCRAPTRCPGWVCSRNHRPAPSLSSIGGRAMTEGLTIPPLLVPSTAPRLGRPAARAVSTHTAGWSPSGFARPGPPLATLAPLAATAEPPAPGAIAESTGERRLVHSIASVDNRGRIADRVAPRAMG
jgi:hypothetical protein